MSIALCEVQRVSESRVRSVRQRVCHEGSVVPGGRTVQGDALSRERGMCRGGA